MKIIYILLATTILPGHILDSVKADEEKALLLFMAASGGGGDKVEFEI